MVFESVRGYVQLASGLSELTRARATEAAHGLLSMQGASIESGSKLAVQVSALAEELLKAATANRHNLTALVRSEVDAAVGRLGLVPAEQLQESQAELATLRAELAALRSASPRATAAKKGAAKKTAVKKTAAKKTVPNKAAAKKAAVKKTATKKTAVKKTAAKKTVPNKAAAKKAAVKKTATKKTAVKKTAAKKASAVTSDPSAVTMVTATRPSVLTVLPHPAGE